MQKLRETNLLSHVAEEEGHPGDKSEAIGQNTNGKPDEKTGGKAALTKQIGQSKASLESDERENVDAGSEYTEESYYVPLEDAYNEVVAEKE